MMKKQKCIPGRAEHRAEILEDSITIEVFSPVRQEYIPRKTGKYRS